MVPNTLQCVFLSWRAEKKYVRQFNH